MDQFRLLRDLGTEADHVVDHSARRWDLDDASVVEGFLVRIETGVGPDRGEFGGADGVGPVCRFQVDRVADRCFASAVRSNFTAAGNRHIINALMGLAFFVEPTL